MVGVILASWGTAASATSMPVANPAAGPVGLLRSPGGPALVDGEGRTVLLHGVNLVYKIAPYEVEVTGSGRNVLTVDEAHRIGAARIRRRASRRHLERAGARHRSDQRSIDLQAGHASYVRPRPVQRLDLRQLCRSTRCHHRPAGPFRDLLVDRHAPGRLQRGLRRGGSPELGCVHRRHHPPAQEEHRRTGASTTPARAWPQAYDHFWANDVVGNLQGEFDTVWTRVAAHYRNNNWVVGYDPLNEPYGPGLATDPINPAFDAELECLYTGRLHPGLNQDGQPITCPADDPTEGLIPRMQAADPRHLIAYEGNYSTDSGLPNNLVGAMDYPRPGPQLP